MMISGILLGPESSGEKLMEECIFCDIQSGKKKTTFIYEDEQIVAFQDISPKAPHHILIIPRKHISTMNDITEGDAELMGKMMIVAAKIAKQFSIDQEGYRVLMNCNRG